MAAGDLVKMPDKATLDKINVTVGASTDTESSTGVTLFARVKYLCSMFISHWTSARATKIDNLDATISSRATQASITSLAIDVGTANNAINGRATQASMDTANANINIIKANTTGLETEANALARYNSIKGDMNTVGSSLSTLETDANALARYNSLINMLATVNTNTARGAVKGVQRGAVHSDTYTGYENLSGVGYAYYLDVPISSVNVNKTFITINDCIAYSAGEALSGANARLVNSTTLRIYSKLIVGNTTPVGSIIYANWQVIEYY
jgi:hypothetical protein